MLRLIRHIQRSRLPTMCRVKSVLVFGALLMGLAGCNSLTYSGNQPLISDDQAALPFDPFALITIAATGAGPQQPITLMLRGDDYRGVDPIDPSNATNRVKFRFMGVADGYYVVQFNTDEASYTYGAVKVDLAGKKIAVLQSNSSENLVARSDDFAAFVKLVLAAIASGSEAVPAYDILATLAAPGSLNDGLAAYQRGDYVMALTILRPLAADGSADAEVALGVMYYSGKGVPQDDDAAAKLYRLAADAGNAQAQNNLGVMFEKGRGVSQDYVEAANWYRRAAAQGNAQAKKNLNDLPAEQTAVTPPSTTAIPPYRVSPDVSGGVLNMRDGPGVGHRIVTAIPAGTEGLTLGDCGPPDDGQSTGQWCRTHWGAYFGWVSSCCVVAEIEVQPSPSSPSQQLAPPPSATNHLEKDRVDLCKLALNAAREAWDANSVYAAYVAQAQHSDLSIDDCRLAIGLPKLLTAQPALAPETEAPVAQKAMLYEEPVNSAAAAPGVVAVNAAVTWSLTQASGGAEIVANIDVPDRNMKIKLTIRRNADKTLPASHVVEVVFDTPTNFPGKGIRDVPRIVMKPAEDARGQPLIAASAKVSVGLFWVALSGIDDDIHSNLALLRGNGWFDLPLLYENGQRAITTFEKGASGERVFDEAITAWAQADWADCAKTSDPDASIHACTNIIDSETETSDRHILAFYNRGLAYDSKFDLGQALDDYRTAARLMPSDDPARDLVLKRIAAIEAQQAPPASPSPPPVATAPSPSGPSGAPVFTGTGIVVSARGQVLTNNHVIDGCTQIAVRRATTPPEKAVVLYADRTNDLALLTIDAQVADEDVAAIRTSPPVRDGEAIAVYGFPLAGTLSSTGNITDGIVSALGGPSDDIRLMQITAPIQPGNSGGPLLDQSGDVVGIVQSKLDEMKEMQGAGVFPQNVNFAIKASVATSFLEAHSVGYRAAFGGTKLDLPAIADMARRFTALIVCQ